MASIVSALEDSAANLASSSTTEREYEHILQVLLEGDNIVVTSLRQNKVKTLCDLFDFLKDQGKVNALKAKNRKGAFVHVSQDRKVELGSIISFINDCHKQSNGTTTKHRLSWWLVILYYLRAMMRPNNKPKNEQHHDVRQWDDRRPDLVSCWIMWQGRGLS